jgi:prepilin-type N-terminal cleavage/methylation domain-containing protein
MTEHSAVIYSHLHTQKGVTLVELMVSATILGLATIGAFAMIGVGRSLDTDEVLRRQAYQFATAALEDAKYGYQNYPLASATTTSGVQLKIDGGQTISATLEVKVGTEQKVSLQGAPQDGGTIQIPYQSVTAKLRWPSASPTDSVYLVKLVADAG